MRYWKRILPLILVLAMLAGIMLPVAAATYDSIGLDETVHVEVSWENPKIFTFVSETGGQYAFLSSDCDGDPYAIVLDSDMDEIAIADDEDEDYNFLACWEAIAGETYYLQATGSGSYNVRVIARPSAESIELNCDSDYGFVGETLGLWVNFYPETCIQEFVTYTSDDETVAMADEYGDIKLLSPGTAVITATTENGLTDTCTVTVRAVSTITLDETVNLIAADGCSRFTFTPEESGSYTFFSIGDGVDTYARILDDKGEHLNSDDDSGAGANFCLSQYMEAGVTYILEAGPLSDEGQGAYQVQITASPAATELVLDESQCVGFVGMGEWLYAALLPEGAAFESITWSSSDETVATVEGYDLSCQVNLHKAGTATVTASTASGLMASCQITVKLLREISCGDEIALNESEEKVRFRFVPETDGYYCFYSTGEDAGPKCRIQDEDLDCLQSDYDSGEGGNFSAVAYLMAGEVYYLDTIPEYSEASADYSVHLEKAVKATALELTETEVSGYVGIESDLDVSFVPVTAIPEDVIWTSSDKSVVTVTDNGGYELVGVGTATITASTDSGLTATCTITVKEPQEIRIGEPVTITGNGGRQMVHFVPETEGCYVFYSTGKVPDTYYTVFWYDQDMEYLGSPDGSFSGKVRFECDMAAGETYYVEVIPGKPSEGAFALNVDPVTEATGIQLSHSQISGAPGDNLKLEASMVPLYATEEELTWTSSDEDVAGVYSSGWIDLRDEGTAVITVTSESGFTASCTVICEYPDAEPIQCGQTVTKPEKTGSYWFRFVPQTDDWYLLSVKTTDMYMECFICDEFRNFISDYLYSDGKEGHTCAQLTAGETYYLRVMLPEESGDGSCTVTIDKMAQPTAITLSTDHITGYVTQAVYLEAELLPQNCIPEITWTSSDEDVVRITSGGNLELCGVGTATVTATTVNGLTATCTITVLEPPRIYEGDSVTLDNVDGNHYFQFIPEQDGWYGFYTTGDPDTLAYLENSDLFMEDDDSGEGLNCMIRAELKAGECYYLTVGFYDEEDEGTYEFHVTALEKPQAIEFNYDRLSGYEGDWLWLDYEFVPVLSAMEDVTLASSDETVAVLDGDGYIHCVAPGTAVITVTTKSGLTDSVTVLVVPIPTDAEEYGKCGPNLLWQLKDGVMSVTGSGEMYEDPSLGGYEFTQLELPEGLTTITTGAFSGLSASSVAIPSTVTSIGSYAFADGSLQEVRFLGSAPEFGSDVFVGPQVTAYYPANDPTWTEEVRGTCGGNVIWVPYEPETPAGVTLSGAVATGAAGDTTLELISEGNVIATATVSGKTGTYTLENVAAGTYTLRVGKTNHVTREYTVTVGASDLTQDVKIHLRGDVDGNGIVNMSDVTMVYAHVKGTRRITDAYKLLVVNVNGGSINMNDVTAVYAHVKGTRKLY